MGALEYSSYKIWKKDVVDKDDGILFDEIIICIDNGAYRSASVMIWNLCVQSLIKKIEILSEHNKKLRHEFYKWKNKKNETDFLELCEKFDLIDEMGFNQLDLIRNARNKYAHPNNISPAKNEVLSYLFFALNTVLSKSAKFSYVHAKTIFESKLFTDPYYLGNKNENQIKHYAIDFINRIDKNSYKSILKLLFEITEGLFEDIEKERCLNIALIFIKQLLLIDANLIDENSCNYFLDNYKKTSCNIFTESEFWIELYSNSKFRVFNYSFDFKNNIFSEIDFLNKFYPLYEKNLLNNDFKNKIDEMINNISLELVFNSSLPLIIKFNRLIYDFKSYDFYTQNPAAKLLKTLDLSKFDDNQLEELGRNLYQSADGGSWESKSTIDYYLNNFDGDSKEYQLIKGCLLEIFVNEKNEFRFKSSYSIKLLKVIHNDIFECMNLELLETIENSSNEYSKLYRYSNALLTLNNWIKKSWIPNVEDIIIHIEIARDKLINKIVEENPHELINYGSNHEIAIILHCSLTPDNLEKFKNLLYDDLISFIKFFSKTSYRPSRKEYAKIEIKWNLLCNFVDLDDLKDLIENECEKELSKKDLQFLKFALEDIEKQ